MIKAFMIRVLNGKWYSAPFFVSLFSIFCWICIFIFPAGKFTWNLFFLLPLLAGFICFLLGVSKLFKKEFKEGIKQCFSTFAITMTAAIFFTVLLPKSPYKKYNGDVKNPDNVKLEQPLQLSFNDEKPLFKVKAQDVILYDYNQPGMYKYEVFLNKIEKGKAYLRIFDLTTDRVLSEAVIKKESQMEVFNPTDELKEFGLSKQFTVDEGDWGNYYGSRVEVWFQPEDTNQPERKLLTKYYVIQGW
ncbi:hypothetical protein [Chryseobacterium sp. JUb7]|uniref:hypothetical protein n=1 Tax=Chryseobacterium sp. JUb7 TaxID=2940599 RepID=UPI002167E2A8|nr:hypothetical protein [Chryseobacterium sp. JUb7]MCS3528739.1 hypothetical protein [Chryseobacterium sp. JUb7]